MEKVKLLMTWMVLCAFMTSFKAYSKEAPKIYAVVIGVSQCKDPGITSLRYAHKDAEAYKAFLQSPKGGSIADENIALLTNEKATRSNIIKSVRNYYKSAGDDDMIIFYYSGHGVPDSRISSDLYLATYDTESNNVEGSALNRDEIIREITHSRAKLKVFLMDACHAGGSGIQLGTKSDVSADINQGLQKAVAAIKAPSWVAITACSGAEKSYEDAKWDGGHGIFTHALLRGLEGEADQPRKKNSRANGDGNGIVTARELFDFLYEIVPAETGKLQRPGIVGRQESVLPLGAVDINKLNAAIAQYEGSAPEATTTEPEQKPKIDLNTTDLARKLCVVGIYVYGEYRFYNDFGEPILLYGAYGGNVNDRQWNVMISSGEMGVTPLMMVGSYKDQELVNYNNQIKFYFKTIDDSKPIRYGTLILQVEPCKSKGHLLNRKNFYVSTTGEKW